MLLMGYGNYIRQIISSLPAGEPIFTEDIVSMLTNNFNITEEQAKKIVNTNLERLKGKELESFRKGIYYKPKKTAFGNSILNPVQVAVKIYIKKESQIFGYETGASMLQKIGLTTQMPKYKYIATNKYQRNGSRIIDDMNVVVRKPYAAVSNDNYLYLQLLDAIQNKEKIAIEIDRPEQILNDYIEKNHIDYGILIAVAKKYYGNEVVLRVSELAVKTKL